MADKENLHTFSQNHLPGDPVRLNSNFSSGQNPTSQSLTNNHLFNRDSMSNPNILSNQPMLLSGDTSSVQMEMN